MHMSRSYLSSAETKSFGRQIPKDMKLEKHSIRKKHKVKSKPNPEPRRWNCAIHKQFRPHQIFHLPFSDAESLINFPWRYISDIQCNSSHDFMSRSHLSGHSLLLMYVRPNELSSTYYQIIFMGVVHCKRFSGLTPATSCLTAHALFTLNSI